MSRPLSIHSGQQVIARNELGHILIAYGNSPPSDGAAGYAVGCIFMDQNASAGSTLLVNEGSTSSADFNILTGGADLASLTATAAELNRVADASGRIVTLTAGATALAVTATEHAERLIVLPVITSAGLTITLPAATGTGNHYRVLNKGVQTVSVTITALAGDLLSGLARGWHLTAGANDAFAPDGSDDVKWTFNVTTSGGDGGDIADFWDVATDSWFVNIDFFGSGTLATGFA